MLLRELMYNQPVDEKKNTGSDRMAYVRMQDKLVDYLEKEVTKKHIKVVSKSTTPGSTGPDVIAKIFGTDTQFEVKSRDLETRGVVVYDATLGPDQGDPLFDQYISLLTDGKFKSFSNFISKSPSLKKTFPHYKGAGRSKDKKFRWPGEKHDGKTSGDVYTAASWNSKNHKEIIDTIGSELINHLMNSDDDYLVLFLKGKLQHIFNIGSNNSKFQSQMNYPSFPPIKDIVTDTYRGAKGSKGNNIVMRVKF